MASALEWFSAIGAPVAQGALGIGTNFQQAFLMRKNQRWQEQMMSQQNEYNSPAAQRARAIRAGVAPNFAPQGAAGVQGVVNPSLNVPDMSSLGDSASKFRDYEITGESLKQQRLQTYMAGIDKQLYLSKQLVSLSNEIADLEKKGVETKESKQRLDNLAQQYDLIEKQLPDLVRLTSNEADLIGARFRETEDFTRRESARVEAEVKHLSVQEKIDWYNANTSRLNSESQGKLNTSLIELNNYEKQRVNQVVKSLIQENIINENLLTDRIAQGKLERHIAQLNKQEKEAVAAMVGLELEIKDRKNASRLNQLYQRTFGMDFKESLDALNLIGIFGLLRGSRSSVGKMTYDDWERKQAQDYQDWKVRARRAGVYGD